MQKTTFIYALCEPGTRTVRYIGKADVPEKRLKAHLRQSIKHKSHLGNWLRLLVSGGKGPTLVVLREVLYDKHAETEKRYIRVARSLGINLVNSTAGGEGCSNPSPETRSKMGHRGEKNHMFGKTGALCPFFQESHPMFGKNQTPESNAKRSLTLKGRPFTESHIAALVEYGKSARGANSPNFGKIHTPEHIAKFRLARTGTKDSEQTKANKKAASLLRWAKWRAAALQ